MEHDSDSRRLEEGLQQLRELGYLQTSVERYVARKVPVGAPLWKVAPSVGLWVGIPGGLVFAWILVISAWLSNPSIADDPSQLGWLAFDMSVALGLLGFVSTTAAAAISLCWLRGRGRSHRRRLTQIATYAPSLVAGLYLTDRLGQHLLVALPWKQWVGAVILVIVVAGALASLMTWLQSAMFATARLQWKGVWDPPRVGWQERSLPFLVVASAAALLVVLGPYRGETPLPRLDEIVAPPPHEAAPLLVLAIDGAGPEALPASWGSARELFLLPSEQAAPPTVFWNEVATGFAADEHGLRGAAGLGARGVSTELPTSNDDPLLAVVLKRVLPGVGLAQLHATDRRELQRPQVWEIAAHAGLRAMSINWWATYPAARHPQLEVISDRYFLRGEGDLIDEAVVSPFGLASQLEVEATALGLAVPAPDPASMAPNLATTGDARHWSFALAALHTGSRRLVVAFLGGADIAVRRDDTASESHEVYARHLREMFERTESDLPARVLVLVATSTAIGPRRLWVGGRGIESLDRPSSVRELTPALLGWIGLATGEDMAGPVADGAQDVVTWGRRPDWSPEADRPTSDLEKLRSLGYIGD